jgi:hypothetical protein
MEDPMSQNLPVSRPLTTLLAFASILLATGVQAAEPPPTPIQLASWNPHQLFDSERSVAGVRLSLFLGINRDVTGFDFSTGASKTTGTVLGYQSSLLQSEVGKDFVGFQTSLLSKVGGAFSGFQGAMLSRVKGDFIGFQGALLGETEGSFFGFQGALIGGVVGDLAGMQLGILGNGVEGHMRGFQLSVGSNAGEASGLQIGLSNSMKRGQGLQIGVVNLANEMTGLQLGVINFNKSGFLPVFPIFNFGL